MTCQQEASIFSQRVSLHLGVQIITDFLSLLIFSEFYIFFIFIVILYDVAVSPKVNFKSNLKNKQKSKVKLKRVKQLI